MSAKHIFSCLLILCLIAALHAQDWNKDIWNRYRHELIKFFSPRYCADIRQPYQNNQCTEMDTTVFQFVDEPRDALWTDSNVYLDEDVCKFVPKWSTSFEPKCAGFDCTFEKAYSNILMKFPVASAGANAFLKFKTSPRDSFDKVPSTLPWRETTTSELKKFMEEMKQAPESTTQFSISVDRNVPITFHHNPWGLKTPLYADPKPFVRSISVQTNKAQSDDDEGLTDFLFRRRRSPPPPVQVRPVQQIIKSNTFKVNFAAKGLRAIRVEPGQWFNKTLLETYKNQIKYVFGPNGLMPLVPETFFVAYKPRVEMIVSESVLGSIKSDLQNPKLYAYLIGGAHFSKYNTVPLSDEEALEMSSNKEKQADSIYWEELTEDVQAEMQANNKKTENATTIIATEKKRSSLLRGNVEKDQEYEDEAADEKAENTAQSDWFWRRRRRSPPPPPPPPPPAPKIERNYRIVFQSNSPVPQIVAVVSRILATKPFDCIGYLSRYRDLRVAFHDNCAAARDHFFKNGVNEGRDCDPAENPQAAAQKMKFDCYSYLARYSNLKQAFGTDCAAAKKHYFETGYDQNLEAKHDAALHAQYNHLINNFNCRYYLAAHQDVASAVRGNCDQAKKHYLSNGIKEGRVANAQFDCYSYLVRYQDLRNAFLDNCQRAEAHWYANGIREKRSADFDANLHNKIAQFNCNTYMNKHADVKRAVRNNCILAKYHWLRNGIKEGRTF